jgi:hypothetical protein
MTTRSSAYVFYDRARSFTFRTSAGLPDYVPLHLFYDSSNRMLSWTRNATNQSLDGIPYLGANHYYELLAK